jgi:hypothetical protein
MTNTTPYEIRPIGYVESPLVDRETAPTHASLDPWASSW